MRTLNNNVHCANLILFDIQMQTHSNVIVNANDVELRIGSVPLVYLRYTYEMYDSCTESNICMNVCSLYTQIHMCTQHWSDGIRVC